MKRTAVHIELFCLMLLTLTLGACGGQIEMQQDGQDQVPPRVDGLKCPPEQMTCTGEVDQGTLVCTCDDTWFCKLNPKKCHRERPTPGGGGWRCSWENENKYQCTKKGTKDENPGGQQWLCTWNAKEHSWSCLRIKTTVPPGGGFWKCVVDNETHKLICTPDKIPGVDGWQCKTVSGQETCHKGGETGGLPPGATNWKCHQVVHEGVKSWICHGTKTSGTAPPGGGGWKCVKFKTEQGQDHYRCIKPQTKDDVPPGGGSYACSKGSEFSGTRCVKVADPKPWHKGKSFKCSPGTKMWCDGKDYCGWGQVTCKPNGQWPSEIVNGEKALLCKELPNYRRPNTTCACYHFFYKPECCERPDCIVPAGTNGQICPKSPGKLCNYCNALKPECQEAGAKCLISDSYETFCGRLCASNSQCPAGYRCAGVKLKVGTTKQCVPVSGSCYY